jgi:antitoxin FitA
MRQNLERAMAGITIRNIDAPLKARLRVRAASHGRSMEEEVRQILRTALLEEGPSATNLAEAIGRRFAPLGGVNLAEHGREPLREPPSFEG